MKDFSKYIISDNSTIHNAICQLNELMTKPLVLFVVSDKQEMVGSITDGDIRRHLVKEGKLDDNVTLAMNKNFHFIQGNIDVLQIKEYKNCKVGLLPYLNEDKTIQRVLNFETKKTVLPIDAVLMAGGKGERLRPLTENCPKPLLEIGNRAIIDYNIENLLNNGVEHISVTVNYLKEQLEAHFSNPMKDGVKVNCVREPKFLGTIGAVKFVETIHNDTVLVMNSDLFTNIDLESFYIHFYKNNADMSVATVPYSVNIPFGVFEIENIREIIGIKEKPSYHYQANAGIYLIKKSVLDLVPQDEFFNATDLIEKIIEQKGRVIRYPISGYWIDVGNPADFQKAQDFAKHINGL